MQRHIDRLAARLQRGHKRCVDLLRIDDWNAGVEADDLDVIDGSKPGQQFFETPGRQNQRIAAGEDHLPDLRMGADIVESGIEFAGIQRTHTLRTDHLAAKAESAIDGADMHRL